MKRARTGRVLPTVGISQFRTEETAKIRSKGP